MIEDMNGIDLIPGKSYRFFDIPIGEAAADVFMTRLINGGWDVGGPLPSDDEDLNVPPVAAGFCRIWNINWVKKA